MKSVIARSLQKPVRRLTGFSSRLYASTPDPSPDSKTAKFLAEHAPFAVTTYARPPMTIVKAKGSHMFDMEGNKYIDFTSGIAVCGLGHADKEIADIAYDQLQTLGHSSNLYFNDWTPRLNQQLVETTLKHGGMRSAARVFLANSGSEANEAALKFARKYGKVHGGEAKNEVVSFKGGFHGRTFGALSATATPKYQDPFGPMVPGFKHGEYNNIEQLDSLITDKTCGVIVEPIQGEGGVNEATAEFLTALRRKCDEVNAVLIFDEIQCGLGRTGTLWAHQAFPDAHPDILSMAKALGNGYPIGATLVAEKVEEVMKTGDHGTTYGGNPLGARIACNVLSRLSSDEILDGVAAKSKVFKQRLQEIQNKYPEIVVEVRGRGLILGVQLSVDPSPVISYARQNGLLVITAGNNTIRIVPALNIDEADINAGLDVIEEGISKL